MTSETNISSSPLSPKFESLVALATEAGAGTLALDLASSSALALASAAALALASASALSFDMNAVFRPVVHNRLGSGGRAESEAEAAGAGAGSGART